VISQQDGARLMWAAVRWIEATQADIIVGSNKTIQAEREAKKAFAELVAQLTDSEGL
jgi:hypothetical protein